MLPMKTKNKFTASKSIGKNEIYYAVYVEFLNDSNVVLSMEPFPFLGRLGGKGLLELLPMKGLFVFGGFPYSNLLKVAMKNVIYHAVYV